MPESMHKVVPASQVDGDHITCPSCGGSTLVLEGYAQKPYAVELFNSVQVNEIMSDEPWRHDVKRITCKRCNQVTEIVSDQLWTAWQQMQAGRKPC